MKVIQTLQDLHNIGHHIVFRVTEPEKEEASGLNTAAWPTRVYVLSPLQFVDDY